MTKLPVLEIGTGTNGKQNIQHKITKHFGYTIFPLLLIILAEEAAVHLFFHVSGLEGLIELTPSFFGDISSSGNQHNDDYTIFRDSSGIDTSSQFAKKGEIICVNTRIFHNEHI